MSQGHFFFKIHTGTIPVCFMGSWDVENVRIFFFKQMVISPKEIFLSQG
jgi:hypothetical protein